MSNKKVKPIKIDLEWINKTINDIDKFTIEDGELILYFKNSSERYNIRELIKGSFTYELMLFVGRMMRNRLT